MAKNEPNMPDEVKTGPANELPTEEKAAPVAEPLSIGSDTPTPEVSTVETTLPETGDAKPFSGEVVVPFDKINEIVSEKQATARAAEDRKEPEATAPEDKAPDKKAERKGRPPKVDKAEKEPKPEKPPKAEKAPKAATKKAAEKEEAPPPAPEQPPEPREAPRKGEQEQIVFINLSELHAFKDHPFSVRNDEEMRAMVESVRDKGVTQPAIVRPREDGGYEIVSGHRWQTASELAGYAEMPCIVRNLTDEEAITQMVEDNTNQRENILPSERAKALKMQLEAIKQQGARTGNGQRSNEVVAERNKMTVKQVQAQAIWMRAFCKGRASRKGCIILIIKVWMRSMALL